MAPAESSVADPAPEPRAEPVLTDDSAPGHQAVWSPADQTAWEKFFEDTYEVLISAGVWWGGNRQDAEDAADYAMEELRVRWHEIRNRAGYARRMVINYVTRAQQGDRDKIKKIVAKTAYAGDQCDDHRLTAYEDEQWILQLLDCLPPVQRAVMARVYDGLSYEEIAQQLGKNVPTVRKHLQLARDRLKQELSKQGEQVGGPPVSASNPAAAPRKEISR
jgi:RNA polymerase sigma factor (sigma-70 family)